MSAPCEQAQTIKELEKGQATLEFNQKKFMEMLVEVRDDVKEMKKFIFEGGMDDKFVSKKTFEITVEFMKEQLAQREKEIAELRRNQNKVAWIVISTVIVALLGVVIVPKIF